MINSSMNILYKGLNTGRGLNRQVLRAGHLVVASMNLNSFGENNKAPAHVQAHANAGFLYVPGTAMFSKVLGGGRKLYSEGLSMN
jgi:hypothetical protein